MHRILAIALVAVFAAGCSGGNSGSTTTAAPTTTTPPPGTYSIDILGTAAGYGPAALTIHAGDRVKWHNTDEFVHTATADTGTFPSTGDLAAGATSPEYTFADPGTYPYHCAKHPTTMHGTITVQ